MRLALEAQEPYSLDLSLKPSFVSSMYIRSRKNSWIKIAGTLGGLLKLEQRSPRVVTATCRRDLGDAVIELIRLETGLWHGPFEELVGSLPYRDLLEGLARMYPGVRIPIAPHDFGCIFLAAALSRRTSYERFVLRWCRKIWNLYGCDPAIVSGLSLEDLKAIGSSYQVLQLMEILEDFRKINVDELRQLPPDIARLRLLSIRMLGPKAVDSLILSTFRAPHFIPCDTHLYRVASRLGFVEPGETCIPQKSLCLKYACTASKSKITGAPCPKSGNCIREKLSWLGEAGGWFQTLAYIHGSKVCRARRPLCSKCILKESCQYPLRSC